LQLGRSKGIVSRPLIRAGFNPFSGENRSRFRFR